MKDITVIIPVLNAQLVSNDLENAVNSVKECQKYYNDGELKVLIVVEKVENGFDYAGFDDIKYKYIVNDSGKYDYCSQINFGVKNVDTDCCDKRDPPVARGAEPANRAGSDDRDHAGQPVDGADGRHGGDQHVRQRHVEGVGVGQLDPAHEHERHGRLSGGLHRERQQQRRDAHRVRVRERLHAHDHAGRPWCDAWKLFG